MLLCYSLCQKVHFVQGQRYAHDDDAITIFDAKVRNKKPVVSDGNVQGSGSETRSISNGQNLDCLIILEDYADGRNSITISQVELAANF